MTSGLSFSQVFPERVRPDPVPRNTSRQGTRRQRRYRMSETTMSAAPPSRKIVLGIDLQTRVAALTAAMLAPAHFETSTAHGEWLLERYREIVPTVLPQALHSMETGERIGAESLEAIRRSASAMRDSGVPLSVVLRGSTPALRVFGAFMQARESRLSPQDLTVLMGRAALIAGELGACWAEAWADARGASSAQPSVTDGESLSIAAVPGTVASPALEMLALVASGLSTEQIAEATDYSPQAVKWHLARLMRQWKVDTRTSLVTVALARGVLTAR